MKTNPYDIESLWDRIKDYIDVEKIKGDSVSELAKSIESAMREGEKQVSGKSGGLDRLIRNDFAEKLASNETVQQEVGFEKQKTLEQFPTVPVERVPVAKVKIPSFITPRAGNKLAVKTKSGVRVFSEKSLRITQGTRAGKPAVFVYNIKLKKRITWRVIE